MKKYIALIVVVLLASFAISGIALAGADVQELKPYPFPPAAPRDADASGKAVVNQPMVKVCLQVTVSAKGLDSEETYEVWIGDTKDWTSVGTFITNKNGNGHLHKNYRKGDTLPTNLNHVAINQPSVNKSYTVLMDADF